MELRSVSTHALGVESRLRLLYSRLLMEQLEESLHSRGDGGTREKLLGRRTERRVQFQAGPIFAGGTSKDACLLDVHS